MDPKTLAFVTELFAFLNKTFDILAGVAFLIGLFYFNYRSLVSSAEEEIKEKKKRTEYEAKERAAASGTSYQPAPNTRQQQSIWFTGIGRAIFLWVIQLIFQAFFVTIFIVTPDTAWLSADSLRWIEIILGLSLVIYLLTRKYGGWRGLISLWIHLFVILTGWNTGRWLGIFFVALPLLAILYYLVYRFAEIIIPASEPEDRKERFERFKVLSWYLWGMQFPISIVADSTGDKIETRIDGDAFQDFFGAPGYLWSHSNQAVGLTGGTIFSRVEGPGAIYTKIYERPLLVVDLRTQLRISEIEAITQDGIPIKLIVFMSFAVDREPWNRDLYNRLKNTNPLLKNGMTSDYGCDHFLYSRQRVRSVIALEGIRSNVADPAGALYLHWDEQVVHMVEEAARRIISEIPLSELWIPNPQQDANGRSALDLIADRIKDEKNKKGLFSICLENGVRLYAARVVNYFLLSDKPELALDGITRQQIPAWRARWEKQIRHKLAEAATEAEQKELDANALARSLLLTTIAQSLQIISENNKDLPRYLIAMRFLGALDEKIRMEPGFATEEKGKHLRERFAFLEGKSPPPGS